MSVNIQLEWTPNPNTLKYVVDVRLIPSGAVNFTSKESTADRSPLAAKLFDVPGVVGIMVGTNFVTVTKGDQGEWDELNDGVMATIETHVGAGLPVLTGEALATQATPAATGAAGEIEQKIRQILDDEIRPAVANDGGDITLERYESGIAYLHLQGSCAGCPSSTMTLKMGIESRLREVIPEVTEVVAV
ncbi:MAG: NifU family protein [Deltaproteobacteria bacterium]|nr:NifU family protein [Deltaproteobacteria bacterium]